MISSTINGPSPRRNRPAAAYNQTTETITTTVNGKTTVVTNTYGNGPYRDTIETVETTQKRKRPQSANKTSSTKKSSTATKVAQQRLRSAMKTPGKN